VTKTSEPDDTFDDDKVQRILDECLATDMARWSQAVASACDEHPEHADELQLRFGALKSAGLVGDADESAGASRLFKGSRVELEPLIREIGPYRLGEVVGQGGMGTVYRAEQTEPIARTVAVKLIRAGFDTEQAVARFEAERRALALMDHPYIARVLDAGATPKGRPFVVMEFVDGTAITDYANRTSADLEARLRLWIQVCEAIQHAHQKGVLHRDIKPSNVLVTEVDGRPVPKVIDFGLARALDSDELPDANLTRHGQVLGTPSYMSPEQAVSGERDVDSRADIYALGVLGFELLTGSPPLDRETVSNSTWPELVSLIQERPAPRPSSYLARTDPARARRLRGDLDWIIQKALEKDRERRYATVAALAEDIERHLAHEPVLASAPSATYRMRKFARRYRLQVVAGGLVLLALIGGTVGTSIGLLRSERINDELRQVAEFQASQLKDIVLDDMGDGLRDGVVLQVRAALERDGAEGAALDERTAQLEGLLSGANFTDLARDMLKVNVFERALSAIDEDFGNQPLVQARLLQTVARTLRDLGLLEMALAPQRSAVAIRRERLGDEHEDTLESLIACGLLLGLRGDWPAAEALYRESMAGRRKILGVDHLKTVDAMNNLAVALSKQGKNSEAEPLHREAVESSRRVMGPEHPATLTAMNNLATMLDMHGGKLAEAEVVYREVLSLRRRVLGDDHANTLISLLNLGQCLARLGKLMESELLCREGVTRCRRVHGDLHFVTLGAIHSLAKTLRIQGRLADAEVLRRESVAGFRSALGDDHVNTRLTRTMLMELLAEKGAAALGEARLSDAEAALLEAHELSVAVASEKAAAIVGQLVTVYEQWQEREPEKGHAARAENWRKKQLPVPASKR
jgi:serine/threonine protein kinase